MQLRFKQRCNAYSATCQEEELDLTNDLFVLDDLEIDTVHAALPDPTNPVGSDLRANYY